MKSSFLSSIGESAKTVTNKITDTITSPFSKEPHGGLWDGADDKRRTSMDNYMASTVNRALSEHNADAITDGSIAGKMLLNVIDHAAGMQSDAVVSYVDWVRSRHQDASPAQIQKIIDTQFRNFASSAGGAAGLASAVPGVGIITGVAAISADAAVFIDTSALYMLASAYLRGADVTNKERRRALILLTILGSQGNAIVDTVIGEVGAEAANKSATGTLSKLAPAGIAEINKRLSKRAMKVAVKRWAPAWLGKLMPLGIGAVIGWGASRKISGELISHVHDSLGPTPETFETAAPDKSATPPRFIADAFGADD